MKGEVTVLWRYDVVVFRQYTHALLMRRFVRGYSFFFSSCCCKTLLRLAQYAKLPCMQVVIRDVWFKYPSRDKPALQNVSLSLRPGHIVALVGLSGSGKSTLVSLIERHYDPTNGRVRTALPPAAN